MAIKKIDHVSILSNRLAETVEFYKKYMGYDEESSLSVPAMHMRIIMLKKDGERIEIIEPTGRDIRMADGIKHIAFLSDNIEEDFNFFRESGAVMLHQEIQKHENMRFFFVKSPSGEFAEIIQYSE